MKQLFKLSLASVLVAGSVAVQAGTLADVLDRGELHCGRSEEHTSELQSR